jgi:malonyl CoA-acyl carrier protein transacylase
MAVPMIMNVDACVEISDFDSMKLKLLAGINNPVLWYPSIQKLVTNYPSSIFLELGSGNTLTNLLLKNKQLQEAAGIHAFSISTKEDVVKFT